MKRLALAIALAGCTTMQSARVLAPGKTQVSAGVARSRVPEYGALWLGEVRVAHGVTDGFELGAHVSRTPGSGETISALGIDPKVRLGEWPKARISAALPVSLAWDEKDSDVGSPTLLVLPALFLGYDMSPETELVFAPRGGLVRTTSADTASSTLYAIGATLALHIGDRATGAGVHPELGVLMYGGGGVSTDVIATIGLSVTAGN